MTDYRARLASADDATLQQLAEALEGDSPEGYLRSDVHVHVGFAARECPELFGPSASRGLLTLDYTAAERPRAGRASTPPEKQRRPCLHP
jgi:hypothetical protein